MKELETLHSLLADLKSCSARKDLSWGRSIHARAVESGNQSNLYVATALVNMYSKCGSMNAARWVFDTINNPNVVSWSVLLLGYAENGQGLVCLELFSKMKTDGCEPNSITYVAVLKACPFLPNPQGLEMGRCIHFEVGCHLNLYVQNTLIDMYAKCGSMVDAQRVFESIRKPDVVSWNALLTGYADRGEAHLCLELFSNMKATGCVPYSITYVAALKACSSLASSEGLEMGRKIHLEIASHLDPHVQSMLIDMYCKCGSMVDARQVFDTIRKPDTVSWNTLLLGYAETGEGHLSLELFSKMKADGCAPNSATYLAALKGCTCLAIHGDGTEKTKSLETGRRIHSEIGCSLDLQLQNMLIDMYAKCSSMLEARQVFDSIQKPNVVSWTTLILGYAENGQGHVALDLFTKMKASKCAPNAVTYVAALKACCSIGALALGRKLHSDISEFSVRLVSCLVDFYAKCGSMHEARAVFDEQPNARDITTWNALLLGYSRCGDTGSVFLLFEEMQDMGFRPDGITFVCVLSCCSHAGLVRKARQYWEAMTVQYRIAPAVYHYNCIVDVLGRANQLNEAVSVLRRMPCIPTAVTWRALLSACHKWNNAQIGSMAFQYLVEMDETDASGYVLMASIYGNRGMLEEQNKVLQNKHSARNQSPGQAYVADAMGRMVKFVVGKDDPPEVGDHLTQLLQECDAEKEHFPECEVAFLSRARCF